MARGRKANNDNVEEIGVLKLIKFNPDIIEEKRNQNLLLDEYVSVSVDINGNWELFQIKQITVTLDNIKSTTTVYGDKYKIGDTYQEWISMGKYLGSYEGAVEYYSNLKFNNEVSRLKYCADVKELIKIRQSIHDELNSFMIKNTIPEIAKQISATTKELYQIKNQVQEMVELRNLAISECNTTINIAKENRKIIVENMPKQKKHPIKEEQA